MLSPPKQGAGNSSSAIRLQPAGLRERAQVTKRENAPKRRKLVTAILRRASTVGEFVSDIGGDQGWAFVNRKVGYAVVISLCVWAPRSICDQPTRVTTTTIHPEGDVVEASYFDGLGTEVQRQSRINASQVLSSAWFLVSGTYRDERGRDSLTLKSYPELSGGLFAPMCEDEPISRAQEYYDGLDFFSRPSPDCGGFPFSEVRYWADPLGRLFKQASEGIEYSLNDDHNVGPTGHHITHWYLGSFPGQNGRDETGFVSESNLTDGSLIRNVIEPVLRVLPSVGTLAELNALGAVPSGTFRLVWVQDKLRVYYYYTGGHEPQWTWWRPVRQGDRYIHAAEGGPQTILTQTGDSWDNYGWNEETPTEGSEVYAQDEGRAYFCNEDLVWEKVGGYADTTLPPVRAVVSQVEPTSPQEGDMYWEADDPSNPGTTLGPMVYNGTEWHQVEVSPNERFGVRVPGDNDWFFTWSVTGEWIGQPFTSRTRSYEVFGMADGRFYSLEFAGGFWKFVPLNTMTHSLVVTRDPNGNYSQKLQDNKGNVSATWARTASGTSGETILASYDYDADGQILQETPPKGALGEVLADPATYAYRTSRKVCRMFSPDAGPIRYAYDARGEVKYEMSAVDSSRDSCLEYVYDHLGRVSQINKVHATIISGEIVPVPDSDYRVLVRYFYDRIDALRDVPVIDQALSDQDFADIASAHIRGRLVAEIAYDESPRPHKIIDLYGYTARGAVARKYKIIPGLAHVQKTVSKYDVQDKLVSECYEDAGEVFTTVYSYDAEGRLSSVAKSDQGELVSFDYTETGLLTNRRFGRSTSVNPRMHLRYGYNSRNWLVSLTSGNQTAVGFSQDLRYAEAGQYNGNVGAMTLVYPSNIGPKSMVYAFSYDAANRLTGADATVSGLADDFDEEFGYDQVGRFTYRKRGTESAQPYEYYNTGIMEAARTNRLARVNGYHGDPSNFVFDLNGNMILDKSKKMAVRYDWRNLPVAFIFYDGLPLNVTAGFEGEWSDPVMTIDQAIESAVNYGTEISRVTMLYDAQGNRVYKVLH